MTEENTELLDAEEFKETLIARINAGDEKGRRIREYLKNIVPNWHNMRATLLHKYIKDTLKSAEENRRFEMDIVVKRIVSIIPLMVIFLTAFGYLGFITYKNIITPMLIDWSDGEESQYFRNKGDSILILILAIIAYINVLLSITLSLIDAHGYRWQKNWEYHIEYLQAIFGIKLMQAFLGNKMKNALTSILIIRFNHIIFMLCFFGGGFSLVLLILSFFLSSCREPLFLGFCDIVDVVLFFIACFATILFVAAAFSMRSIIVPFIEKGEMPGKDTMSINPLPKLCYTEIQYTECKCACTKEQS